MFIRLALIISALSTALISPAQADEKALQNALAKAQYMLRQAATEKQDLQRQLDDTSKELEQSKQDAAHRLAVKEKTSKNLGEKLDLYSQKYTELQKQYLDILNLLREQQAVNESLDAKLTAEVAKFDQCRDHNIQLFTLNEEILGKYEHKGFWDVLAKNEPITRLKQVEIENIVQKYRFANEDLQIDQALLSKDSHFSQQQADN